MLAAGDRAGEDALAEARTIKEQDGTSLERVTALAAFLASDESGGLTGRLISAVWDDWEAIPSRLEAIMGSDLYIVRRVLSRLESDSADSPVSYPKGSGPVV